jgi:hypothetical protein
MALVGSVAAGDRAARPDCRLQSGDPLIEDEP